MQKASTDHFLDISKNGICSHKGSDGSSFKERIEKYALWGGGLYQAIVYEDELEVKSCAKEIVKYLIVDEHIPGKNNRKNLLADHHVEFGMMSGPHPKTGKCYVLMFAGQIIEHGSPE